MEKKKLIMIGGSIIGILILLILILWLMTLNNHKYYSYDEVEEMIVNATKNYYKNNPELLPVNDGRQSLPYSTLVENKFIQPLNELLEDGKNCTADIIVYKNSDNYSYIPKLSCGDKYKTITLYEKILSDNNVVASGSGLYKDEEGNYFFRGKIKNNYVTLGTITKEKKTTDILWRIISVNNDNTVTIKALTSLTDKTVFDNRYNVDKKSNTGYNNFEESVLKDYLKELEGSSKFLKPEEENKLVSRQLCIGTRELTDNSKDGKTECSTMSSGSYIYGVITPYEYLRASTDDNCNTMEDLSCENFNYITDDINSSWTLIPVPNKSHQVYSFDGKTFYPSSASNSKKIYATVNVSELATYKSGDGSKENPYRLFKKVTQEQ